MLFRFSAAQAAEQGIVDLSRAKRPRAITTVDSIPACEKWRGQVLKEISRKVTKIQDSALSDFQIRDLNDDINKLMREKYVWELRIRDLGGPNYMRGGRVVDDDGKEVPGGGKGYRYFGRARELPGVKELFEQATQANKPPEERVRAAGQSRAELARIVDASYYGFNLDEEDGTLLEYEAKREQEAFQALVQQPGAEDDDPDWEPIPGDSGDGVGWTLPTLQQVQEELVERRRKRLLDKLG
jgi:pre-mRNA-splicing factor ISY1